MTLCALLGEFQLNKDMTILLVIRPDSEDKHPFRSGASSPATRPSNPPNSQASSASGWSAAAGGAC